MRALHLLAHRLTAQSWYDVHSPFVFRFLREVAADRRHFYAFDEIAATRQALRRDRRVLTYPDLGAGPAGRTPAPGAEVRSTVARLARRAACPPRQGELLFRLVEWLAPATILELGTSLGLGTRYLAGPGRHRHLVTIEGAPAVAAVAAEHLAGLPGVEQRVGPFDGLLEPALRDLGRLDLLYLDGHHTEAATLDLVGRCLAFAHPDTCLVLDDIRWSAGMRRAWHRLCTDEPRIRLSLDLGRLGLLFLRAEQRQREHFRLRW